ncbi:MAG: hypothetical protein H7X94_15095, partial [Vallitaleaceae bacterium]|nr:hypothetical protein [Vallitaleaceae bacterium]
MTPEMQEGNILRICVEEYGILPVDKDAFKGEIPMIKNLLPYSPFDFYIQRKLFIHNMGHALAAYLGKLKGYTYIWEAINDPFIKLAVTSAMKDCATAMAIEHHVELKMLLEHVEDLIYRFGNRQLGDTINRVGNDTKRKLSEKDRLAGAAMLCQKQSVNTSGICLGIAAAMHFDMDSNSGLIGVRELIEEKGYVSVLREVCGLAAEGMIETSVLSFCKMLDTGVDLNEIIDKSLKE